jgi:hypothetical protein
MEGPSKNTIECANQRRKQKIQEEGYVVQGKHETKEPFKEKV